MTMIKLSCLIVVLVVICGALGGVDDLRAGVGKPAVQTVPKVMGWHPQRVADLRRQYQAGDDVVVEATEKLCRDADERLSLGPYTVTDKTFVPPSGDLHDYSTIGRYWWPNPETADGMPWIRRDGDTNPQYFDSGFGDTARFLELWRSTRLLAQAYYQTGDTKYSEKAANLLRVWFVDSSTRMTPHAKYAARFPGHWDGKSWGIHGTRHLADIADAVELLQGASAWTAELDEALRQWYSDYLDWLLTSENGMEERDTINNHSVSYDWLVIRMAVFVGRDDLARTILEEFKARRIAHQIELDGSLPAELNRAKPWRYEGYAMEFLFKVAIQGDRLGVDLWHYQTEDGRGIRPALDYIVQHIEPQPGQVDTHLLQEIGVKRIGPLLEIAASIYQEPDYMRLANLIGWESRLDINWAGPNPALVVGVSAP